MPIDVRHAPMTPEARLAQRLADLERQVAVLGRGSLNRVIRNRRYAANVVAR
jgi:hypothetical protein